MQLIQLWLSVEGQALDYPGIASHSSLDLENGKLTAEFPVEAVEIDAIAARKKFRIDRDFELPVLMHCTPSSTISYLIDDSGLSGYEIRIPKDGIPNAIAWLETPLPVSPKNEDSPTHATSELSIVDKITGDNQVVIKEEGVIQISPDLIGKMIRVRILAFCDRRVVRLLEPLTDLCLHAIIRDNELRYLKVACSPVPSVSLSLVGYRKLEAEFDPKNINVQLL